MRPYGMAGMLANEIGTDPRVDFWRNSDRWPSDAGGYVFMARALLRIGSRAFAGEWSDDAPTTRYDGELPERLWLDTPRDVLMQGVRLLRANDTAYRKRIGSPGLFGNISESQYPTTAEWIEAVEINQAQQGQSWPKLVPFYKAVFEVENACLTGALSSATMLPDGGELTEQPWHFWNYRNAWLRFELCRAHPSEPRRVPKPSDGGHFLFVTQKSLDQVLESYSENAPAPLQPRSAEMKSATIAKRAAGRPPEFDWAAFAKELWNRYEAGQLDGMSVRAVTEGMLQWCTNTWNIEPNESHTREKGFGVHSSL